MRLVYIPVRPTGEPDRFLIRTADDKDRVYPVRTLELVDRQLCAVAKIITTDGRGRVRVELADQYFAWVKAFPVWTHVPQGSTPYTLDSLNVSVPQAA